MFERATREWLTSPTIATCSASSGPRAARIVYRSSRHWVGCWWQPSPALTTWASVRLRDPCGGADGGVADHDHVGVVGRERLHGVAQRLALVDARPGRLQADDVGREPLRRQLERRARAGRRLEEDGHDGAPAQGRHLLQVAVHDRLEALGGVRGSARRRRGRDRRPRSGGGGAAGSSGDRAPQCSYLGWMSTTRSSSSTSISSTLTRSSRAVGRFLPT